MVQRQSLRSRSKSAGRSSKSQSDSKSTPITKIKSRKSDQTDNKKRQDILMDEKPILNDEIFTTTRRLTRQSRRIVEEETNVPDAMELLSDDDTDTRAGKVKRTVKKSSLTKKIGTYVMMFILIILIPFLVFYLNKMAENGGKIRLILPTQFTTNVFFNWKVLLCVIGWVKFLSLFAMLPIGSKKTSTRGGITRSYRCNGALSLIVSTIIFSLLFYYKYLTAKMIYDNYYAIITSSIILAFYVSLVVLIKSYIFKSARIVDNTDSFVMGYMVGREMNPSIFGLDFRFFYEFRPGLISWSILNLVFCLKDLESRNFQSINPSLLMITGSQYIYCLDALLFEGDVVAKSFMMNGRFGLLHCLGNQVIVPFFFTLTSRATQINNFHLPIKCLIGTLVLNLIGFIMYRTSNWQKNSFRINPYGVNLAHLKTLTNEHGSQLLLGGWWGLLRHPNYVGDVIISICWSLYTGLNPICWIYPIYFLLFIISRCIQDDQTCSKKHGKAWDEYKCLVRYRICPYIY